MENFRSILGIAIILMCVVLVNVSVRADDNKGKNVGEKMREKNR